MDILRELQKENLKMQEIARRLDVTATEAFRQLERLSAALLVQRQPEGTYAITQYGRLMLEFSASMEFLFKHKEYFATHDVWALPPEFVNRLGALSQTTFIADTVESLNKGQHMYMEAEQYGWALAEGHIPAFIGPIMAERAEKGLKLRFVIPESMLSTDAGSSAEKTRNMEIRSLPEIPMIVGLTEKEAAACFRVVEGRMDYAGFYGKDTMFLNWAKDLFLYYWNKGKRF
ncbi:MAG: helix-turn-helix transcriptional regulator [Candidatus Bathyarchaeia archaeon]